MKSYFIFVWKKSFKLFYDKPGNSKTAINTVSKTAEFSSLEVKPKIHFDATRVTFNQGLLQNFDSKLEATSNSKIAELTAFWASCKTLFDVTIQRSKTLSLWQSCYTSKTISSMKNYHYVKSCKTGDWSVKIQSG